VRSVVVVLGVVLERLACGRSVVFWGRRQGIGAVGGILGIS